MSTLAAQGRTLTLLEYATQASQTDQFTNDSEQVRMLKFGFFGEIGGLLSALKKVGRDTLLASQTDVAAEEIGDALWYLVTVAAASGIKADELGVAGMHALRKYFGEAERASIRDVSFRNIDGIVSQHGCDLEGRRTALISDLAGQAGSLLSPAQPTLPHGKFSEYPNAFGDLLAALALVAGAFGLRLEDLALGNLCKIKDRWPGPDPQYVPLFDEDMPEHERLPRRFEIRFSERGKGASAHVVQEMNEVFIGDPLTDNSVEPDDYRFHDVFHLAYAAHLGWSPVLRALLKRKRKSNKDIDEKQDGARAIIIEEGIATWIFNYARPFNYFEGVSEAKLEYALLKQVTTMVRGYEVDRCPPWQWARAILAGFSIFREIRKPENRGGIVTVDIGRRLIEFKPMNEAKDGL
jgi:NTP pyrophosphatase (non-canonical NTP hydrolase)